MKNCGIFVAKSSEKWYSNRKLYGTGRLIGHHGDRNYTSIQLYRYKPEKERVRICNTRIPSNGRWQCFSLS